jgi:hypothetical protein
MVVETRPCPSRREALLYAGAIVLAAFGRGPADLASGAPPKVSARTLTLLGREWHCVAAEPSCVERHGGEPATLSGALYGADGERVGAFRGLSHFVDRALVSGAEDACVEQHTFELADGTIVGMGVCTWGASSFAVVGGTGAYSGVRGTYTAVQSPVELGGDGSAEFVFRLAQGEG